MVLKAALHHSDVSITQKYLESDSSLVDAAIRKCDFSRHRTKAALGTILRECAA
jgi:hypothetical protein